MTFKNNGSFFEKTHYLILTCFMFLMCCSFASRAYIGVPLTFYITQIGQKMRKI